MRTVLTVVIDHKLCWKPHVNNFKTKAPKSITSILNLIHTSMRYILCGGLREKKTIKQSWLSQTNKHIVHKFTCTPIHWSYRSKYSITDVQTMQEHVSRRYPEVVPNKKKKKKLSISDLHYAFVWRKQNTTKTSIMRSRESGGEQVLMHGWAESKSEPRCYFPSWVCLFSCVYCSMSPWFVYVWNDALCLIASKTWEASVSCTLVHSSRPMHSFWDLSPDWKHQRPA